MFFQAYFILDGFPLSFLTISSWWLWLGGEEDGENGIWELGDCHPMDIGTAGEDRVGLLNLCCSYLFCFCSLLPSPWALALRGSWKLEGYKERGAEEGSAQSAACLHSLCVVVSSLTYSL